MYRANLIYAPLAQLVEQLTLNQWVLGSSPRWCTKREQNEHETTIKMVGNVFVLFCSIPSLTH